jgi:hypothetical protein
MLICLIEVGFVFGSALNSGSKFEMLGLANDIN